MLPTNGRKNIDFNRKLFSVLSLGYEIIYFCDKTEKKRIV
jgi:hypothetical protein